MAVAAADQARPQPGDSMGCGASRRSTAAQMIASAAPRIRIP